MNTKFLPISFAIISSLVSSTTFASNNTTIMIKKNNDPVATAEYWTAERMRDAEPLDLPLASKNQVRVLTESDIKARLSHVKPITVLGAPPTIHITPNNQPLFKVAKHKMASSFAPSDAGTLKEPFSSQQLTPINVDQIYPYSTVGKLFFKTPKGDKTCSGAVIANRLVLTASHCMHNGNGTADGFYSNWMFVPAYRNGAAPFGKWHYNGLVLSGGWFLSNGVVPNDSDYGIIAFSDQTINGKKTTLGDAVGKLGYQTQSTIPNHAHLLGYPGNLDNGQLMHQVTSQSALAVAPNNVEYGSDMSVGSGGGPWIQNFGTASKGQNGGTNKGRNLVIGLSSYVYDDTNSFAQGSPILDDFFVSIYNDGCGLQVGNC